MASKHSSTAQASTLPLTHCLRLNCQAFANPFGGNSHQSLPVKNSSKTLHFESIDSRVNRTINEHMPPRDINGNLVDQELPYNRTMNKTSFANKITRGSTPVHSAIILVLAFYRAWRQQDMLFLALICFYTLFTRSTGRTELDIPSIPYTCRSELRAHSFG